MSTRLCKYGCGRPAGWETGRLRNVCVECKPIADSAFVEKCAATRHENRLRRLLGCEYRGCTRQSKVRLRFGRQTDANWSKAGQLCPGVNYCEPHAEVVRKKFVVEDEGEPLLTRGHGEPMEACGQPNKHNGLPCQRPRVPGEETCPSHRHLKEPSATNRLVEENEERRRSMVAA